MARLKITEYAAKKLLWGDRYTGVSCTANTLPTQLAQLPDSLFVVKVDTGIKKRYVQGLVKTKVARAEITPIATSFFNSNHHTILIEPYIPHLDTEEHYVSLSLTRHGLLVVYTHQGGVQVETTKNIESFVLPLSGTHEAAIQSKNIPIEIQSSIVSLYEQAVRYRLCFLEINPFVIHNGIFHPLDAAIEIDSAYQKRLPAWLEDHIVTSAKTTETEHKVHQLSNRSTASFSLKLLSPNASIFTLLSGGGASLVTFDTLVDAGLQSQIGNYGEYSGAPTREETCLYAEQILDLLCASTAPKKVLVIAGGVANFTDVSITFSGIVDALTNHIQKLKAHTLKVVVRRGGPHYREGLAHLESFLQAHHFTYTVAGPEKPLADIVTDVTCFL